MFAAIICFFVLCHAVAVDFLSGFLSFLFSENNQVMVMLKKLPDETRKKLAGKGYFPQDGYIIQCLPVPPNCLSVPDVSDGITVMSSVRLLCLCLI